MSVNLTASSRGDNSGSCRASSTISCERCPGYGSTPGRDRWCGLRGRAGRTIDGCLRNAQFVQGPPYRQTGLLDQADDRTLPQATPSPRCSWPSARYHWRGVSYQPPKIPSISCNTGSWRCPHGGKAQRCSLRREALQGQCGSALPLNAYAASCGGYPGPLSRPGLSNS